MAAAGAVAAGAAASARAIATPWQSEGPFYPVGPLLDDDADLIQARGQEGPAPGIPTHLIGRVLNQNGRPIAGARVEIWQCDANGFYHHPRDRGGRADPRFQGFGGTIADSEGRYRFRTIKPVAYPGRTPHIHFRIIGVDGARFSTQMYVAGEPGNADDVLLNRLADARDRVIAPFTAWTPLDGLDGSAGDRAARFDVVIAS